MKQKIIYLSLILFLLMLEIFVIASAFSTYYGKFAPSNKDIKDYQTYIEKSLKYDSCNGEALVEKAKLLYTLNKKIEAKQAIELSQKYYNSLTSYKLQALIYIANTDIKSAIDVLNKTTKMFPMNPIVQLEAADAFLKMNDYQQAIQSLNTAIFLDPQSQTAYYQLAQLYEKLNDYYKAEQNYEKTLLVEKKTQQEKILFRIALINKEKLNNPDKSISALQKLIKISQQPQYYKLLYDNYKQIDDQKSADYVKGKFKSLFKQEIETFKL